MENQNELVTAAQGADMSELKKMFSDFQNKQKNQKGGTARKGAELLTKYFVPREPKETFRILKPKAGKKHIEEAFFHVVTSNISGGKKKYGTIVYCPAHNDPKVKKLDSNGEPILDMGGNPIYVPAPCPLCAKNKKLLSTQDPSLKGIKKENMTDAQLKIKAKNDEIYKEANKWEAKKFFIVRGIDKGQEKDGVKFWRFKYNYRNQGTLDKLLPILEDYTTTHGLDFSDPVNGTDLNIIMTDSEFNGRTYKAISAITAKGKSPLHSDPLVARQWLDDNITWRDVFLPKRAPFVEPLEYLKMLADGTNPYWDDSDSTKKRWVYPTRPDLEELANNRTRDLDADEDENFEQASDLDYESEPQVTINNITEKTVGKYQDDAVDIGAVALKENAPKNETAVDTNEAEEESDKYSDLPF